MEFLRSFPRRAILQADRGVTDFHELVQHLTSGLGALNYSQLSRIVFLKTIW